MVADRASPSFFDRWSRTYDNPLVQSLTYRPVQDAVLTALERQRPDRVLDAGCGTGLFTARVRRHLDTEVVGCDYSWGMIRQARRGSPTTWWVQADSMALPVHDAAVDAVVCTESFHWYPDQERALSEFRRVLRPGGRAHIALINPPLEAISAWTRRVSRRYGQPLTWPTSTRMRAMAARAGLRVVRQDRLRRFPPSVLLPAVLTILERPT